MRPVFIVNSGSSEVVSKIEGLHKAEISALAFSADGKYL